MTRAASDSSLLCSAPGCCRPWTVNFGRRWCSEHDPGLAGRQPVKRQQGLLAGMPLREALPPFNERAERDGDPA